MLRGSRCAAPRFGAEVRRRSGVPRRISPEIGGVEGSAAPRALWPKFGVGEARRNAYQPNTYLAEGAAARCARGRPFQCQSGARAKRKDTPACISSLKRLPARGPISGARRPRSPNLRPRARGRFTHGVPFATPPKRGQAAKDPVPERRTNADGATPRLFGQNSKLMLGLLGTPACLSHLLRRLPLWRDNVSEI